MDQPNILWICTDSQRSDTIAALGNTRIRTPHLDHLCRRGVAFTRAYCQSPICTPSRASFLTGRYPNTVRVPRNGNASYPGIAPLVTRSLSDAGWDCGLVGKLHLASAWRGCEERADDGFTVFDYSHGPWQGLGSGNQYAGWLAAKGLDPDQVFARGEHGAFIGYRPDVPSGITQAHWCGERAAAFIRARADRRWLLAVNFFDPHPPFTPAAEFRGRYRPQDMPTPAFTPRCLEVQQRLRGFLVACPPAHAPGQREQEAIADYYATIELIDEQIGRILEAVSATRQSQRTLVVFHSDHGELLGDHGLSHKGCRFYEGAVRVPLIWSWPGALAEGVVVSRPVGLIDIAPTLSEIARIAQDGMQGRSLLPLLRGSAAAEERAVRCEYHDAINLQAPTRPRTDPPCWASMLVEGQRKLVVYHGIDYGELYDLAADPHELDNLWEHPAWIEERTRMIRRCFDQVVMASDSGPPLIGRY